MYVQRYLPHLPAGGEIVIFDRSWYNRAGVERVMRFCTEEETESFLNVVPDVEKAIVDFGRDPAQVLARGEPRGADQAAQGAHRRRPEDLEALGDGFEVVQPAGMTTPRRATTCSWRRILRGRLGSSRDPTTRGVPAEHHQTSAEQIPYKDVPRHKVKLPKRHVNAANRQTIPSSSFQK